MKVKTDAVRVAALSLGVLVGGVMFMLGVTNAILHFQGEPAPSRLAIAVMTLVGLATLAASMGVAMWQMRRPSS